MTNLEIDNAYVGSDQVDRIYLGADIVWERTQPTPPEPVYSAMPLTFEIISAGTINWRPVSTTSSPIKTIQYRVNNNPWSTITSTYDSPSITVNAGDKVQFVGNNNTYASGTAGNHFVSQTAVFNAYGNVMSLIDASNYMNNTTMTSANTYAFATLFLDCTGLRSAENLILPATTLAEGCYSNMFSGCTELTSVPELGATTLAKSCYNAMFGNCTSLTGVPADYLPVKGLKENCYFGMFRNCTSLTAAPELPATSMAKYCYTSMFEDCDSLATAPSLPGKYLSDSCYYCMFKGCGSLLTAPEIINPTASASYVYSEMFYGSGVNYIVCKVKSPTSSRFSNWVRFVPSTGTFVKHPDATWTTGDSGIPTGWTVQDAVI